MSTTLPRATLPPESSHPATTRGAKENPMKTSSAHLRTFLITLGLGTLALMGMRCNGFTPGGEAYPKATTSIPRYTYKTVIGKVTWPSPNSIDQQALAAIPSAEREKLKLSGVPVLVPRDPKFLKTGIMINPTETGYAFGPADWVEGIDTTINGGRIGDTSDAPISTNAYEQSSNSVKVGEFNVVFYQNEAGTWYGTWGAYGDMGYLMSFRCRDRQDSRCANESQLKELIRNLVFVGGNFIPYETTILDQ